MYESLCKDQRLLVVSIHTEYTAFQATKIELTTQIHIIIEFMTVFYLGTDHLTCRGGYGFLFRSDIFFWTTRVRIFFFGPEFNIRLYDKNSESDFFFSSTKIRIIFLATLGIRIFFRKKTYPPPPGS